MATKQELKSLLRMIKKDSQKHEIVWREADKNKNFLLANHYFGVISAHAFISGIILKKLKKY